MPSFGRVPQLHLQESSNFSGVGAHFSQISPNTREKVGFCQTPRCGRGIIYFQTDRAPKPQRDLRAHRNACCEPIQLPLMERLA